VVVDAWVGGRGPAGDAHGGVGGDVDGFDPVEGWDADGGEDAGVADGRWGPGGDGFAVGPEGFGEDGEEAVCLVGVVLDECTRCWRVTNYFIGIAFIAGLNADVRVWDAVFGFGGEGLVGSFGEAVDFDEGGCLLRHFVFCEDCIKSISSHVHSAKLRAFLYVHRTRSCRLL
jgi:hypothetical protein